MYHIIVNPQGGKGKSLKILKQVCKILQERNAEFCVHHTERKGHATEIARELSREADCNLLVMGGDGSFNEVLCGIENFQNVTLGLIPCGTGNDFVRASAHPSNVKKAMDVILHGETSYVDYIQFTDGRSLNVLGAGMDVDVLLKYESMKHKRKLNYYLSLFYTLTHVRFHHMRITIDNGEPMERNVFMIGIGNGRYIGGGMPVCPSAVIDDGKLQLVIINEIPKSKILGAVLKFLKGEHVKLACTEVLDGKKIKIEILDDSRFEADGEILPQADVLDAKVVSGKLKVFTQKSTVIK